MISSIAQKMFFDSQRTQTICSFRISHFAMIGALGLWILHKTTKTWSEIPFYLGLGGVCFEGAAIGIRVISRCFFPRSKTLNPNESLDQMLDSICKFVSDQKRSGQIKKLFIKLFDLNKNRLNTNIKSEFKIINTNSDSENLSFTVKLHKPYELYNILKDFLAISESRLAVPAIISFSLNREGNIHFDPFDQKASPKIIYKYTTFQQTRFSYWKQIIWEHGQMKLHSSSLFGFVQLADHNFTDIKISYSPFEPNQSFDDFEENELSFIKKKPSLNSLKTRTIPKNLNLILNEMNHNENNV